MLPAVHLADTGFIDAELLSESQRQYGIDLVGLVRGNYRRQAREGQGFATHDFTIDWEGHTMICPRGHPSSSWTPMGDTRSNAVIRITFSRRDCQACPVRTQCTDGTRRTITIRPRDQHEALMQRRAQQETTEFRATYAKRAGIEGTVSQGVRCCGLRRSRSIGIQKTHLQHIATASALNLLRISEWLDDTPHAKTRRSAFERL